MKFRRRMPPTSFADKDTGTLPVIERVHGFDQSLNGNFAPSGVRDSKQSVDPHRRTGIGFRGQQSGLNAAQTPISFCRNSL
jgi:hypothetical protein